MCNVAEEDKVFVPFDLPIELEQKLREHADHHGISLNRYLSAVLAKQVEIQECRDNDGR